MLDPNVVRRLVNRSDMTKVEIAQKLKEAGIRPNSRQALWRYMTGKREPSQYFVNALSDMLGGGPEEPIPPTNAQRLRNIEKKVERILQIVEQQYYVKP